MNLDLNSISYIAFYLPQFHEIKENNDAYGKGFTEWTNVKKAKPLFNGHRQPRIPLNENYYSLDDNAVMEHQAELAKKYGITGFCYYHYWFKGGKKLLYKPLEEMLKNKNVNIPFCLCWANENWTKRWDGGNNEIIVEQDYDDIIDLQKHVDYICGFFKDERYINISGAPLFLIYKPELIPNICKVINTIRCRCKENGFEKVHIACQHPNYYFNKKHLEYFDYYIQFQPAFSTLDRMNSKHIKQTTKRILQKICPLLLNMYKEHKYKSSYLPQMVSYDMEWENILSYKVKDSKLICGAFVDWDNTPRSKKGLVYLGAGPEKFEKYIIRLSNQLQNYSLPVVFVNAWNEWAEGTYLEPDTVFSTKYLEAIRKTLEK